MGDAGLQGIFESVELGFEVGLARDEEEAATDLALTLRQATGLAEILGRRGAFLATTDAPPIPVSCVGRDFVSCEPEGLIAPLGEAHFVSDGALDPPRTSSETFVEVLRRMARAGVSVTILGPAGAARGRLRAAAEDHVELQNGPGTVLVPLGRVALVRLCRGGSTDVP